MKLCTSNWEKHQAAMQQEPGPYWSYLQKAFEKHTDLSRKDSSNKYYPSFAEHLENRDGLTSRLEERAKQRKEDDSFSLNYYSPLTFFHIKNNNPIATDYIVLLDNSKRYWPPQTNPGGFLRRMIAEQIAEKGGEHRSQDPLYGVPEYVPQINFHPDLCGYYAYCLTLRKPEKEIKVIHHFGFHDLPCFEQNTRLIDRFALDIGQFQRVINSDGYSDYWKGFEKEFGKAFTSLTRGFATTSDPDSFIEGLTIPLLLGRMFRK